jgi:ribosomal protein L39E
MAKAGVDSDHHSIGDKKRGKKPRLQKKKKRQAGIPVWCNLKVESTRDELMIVSATFFSFTSNDECT